MLSVRICTKHFTPSTVQVQCNLQMETNLIPESTKFVKIIFKRLNIVQGINTA
jgi:hypothetical protein